MLIPINVLTRLSKDVELRYSPSGAAIARLSFVNSRKYKPQSGEEREDVCFIDGVAFGKTAEIINQYCKKGDTLFIQGLLKQDTWTTDEGKNMSKHSINIEAIDLDLDGRTHKELIMLKEQVMRSELPYNNKLFLIEKIESYLGIRNTKEDILEAIKAGAADIDDIGE